MLGKVVHIVLLSIYLFGTSNLELSLHYCCNNLTDISVFDKVSDDCCGDPCEDHNEHESISKDCCDVVAFSSDVEDLYENKFEYFQFVLPFDLIQSEKSIENPTFVSREKPTRSRAGPIPDIPIYQCKLITYG